MEPICKEIKMVLDQSVIEKYNTYYFKKYPRRHKAPIDKPQHPSINVWMIMQRPAMNNLKQAWKEFICWWVKELGYDNMQIDNFEATFITYMPTKRRSDPDNFSPKFINDGLVESGMLVDDDGRHMKSLTLKTDYDKDHPRTEIYIKVL